MNALVSSAAVAAATPSFALPVITDVEPTDELMSLWRKREELQESLAKNRERINEAERSLPPWALPGPAYMDSDGNRVGYKPGWPEVENPTPPEPGAADRLIRIAPHDLRGQYRNLLDIIGHNSEGRALAHKAYRQELRKCIARLREQRRLRTEVGLDDLNEEADRLCNACSEVEKAIQEQMGPGRWHALAAFMLVELFHEAANEATIAALRTIRHFLRGEIAVATDEALEQWEALWSEHEDELAA